MPSTDDTTLEGEDVGPHKEHKRKLSHIQISEEEVTWSEAIKSTLMMEWYSFIPLPPMIAYIVLNGLYLEYYGDCEYFAYKGQGVNHTNDHLEPPGYNFTWDESVRKFEYKMAFYDDSEKTKFLIGYFLAATPGASISFAILPMLCYGWTDIKEKVLANKKYFIASAIFMVIFFVIMTAIFTPNAMETESKAMTSETVNKLGQLLVLSCALLCTSVTCPKEYTSKFRWCLDCIIPNMLVALVALILFPRTVNPWFADEKRTELERSLLALFGPKLIFFFVLHLGRHGARNITNKMGDNAFGSGAMFVVCFVSTFWGRVFLTGLAEGTGEDATSFSARSTMILTCIAFELLDFIIRYTTNMRDQAGDKLWQMCRGKKASVVPSDDDSSNAAINRVKSSKIVGSHAKRLYGEIQVLEVYFEVMAVTLFPIITMCLEIYYLGMSVGDSLANNLINALIQKVIQIPFTVPIFKTKKISFDAVHAFSMRLVWFTFALLPGFIVVMRYMAFCIVENLSLTNKD